MLLPSAAVIIERSLSTAERSKNRGGQVKIRSIEEHPGMAHAILGHVCIFNCLLANFRSQKPVNIVVMARDALPSSPQLPTAVPPPAQAMQDNNLVPKGTAGVNGGHVADCQIKVWKIVRNVRLYDDGSMRVESRFRARFDLDGATDIRIALGRRSGIPEKQALAVRVSGIGFHTRPIHIQVRGFECLP
jgi:hypothetical protein